MSIEWSGTDPRLFRTVESVLQDSDYKTAVILKSGGVTLVRCIWCGSDHYMIYCERRGWANGGRNVGDIREATIVAMAAIADGEA